MIFPSPPLFVVFAVLGQQSHWNSIWAHVGIQLQVQKAGIFILFTNMVFEGHPGDFQCWLFNQGITKTYYLVSEAQLDLSCLLQSLLQAMFVWVFITVLNFQPTKVKNGCTRTLVLPWQYKDVNTNPDSDCYLLRVTTLNFIFTSVVMGMTLSLVSGTTFTCTGFAQSL